MKPIQKHLNGQRRIFKCYIKKYKACEVTLVVENPYDLRIGDKEGNFELVLNDGYDINRTLNFIFDPSTVIKNSQIPLSVESRPDSALSMSSTLENAFASKISLYDILADCKEDVVFISSEKNRIPSHSIVIAKHSKSLANLFANPKKFLTEIAATDFNTETIIAALDFCYGKPVSFKQQESLMKNILKFAQHFGFTELSEASWDYFKENVGLNNVCKIIQLADLCKNMQMKEKCKQIIIENKAEIEQAKLEALPKNILFDVFVL
uniref:BTB domain-containing protein n=1 Tax=Panagrolaimus davidi TaxID=227884 RepID=A0A914PHJ6_9BILA